MKNPPSLIALELALALARRAADEELKDPGGTVAKRIEVCPGCAGDGTVGEREVCGDCIGTGAVLVKTAG